VAVGRHYRDTAPATGTLYSAGAETMWVEVKVHDLTGNNNGSLLNNTTQTAAAT